MSAYQNPARGAAVEELNQAVSLLLRRAKRFSAARARELDPCLPVAGYHLVVLLAKTGPCRAQQLAEIYGLDKGVVSRCVRQLIDLGLVVRTPDPSDGRATLLDISARGRDRIDESWARRRAEVADTLLSGWSPERVQALASELAAYNEALDGSP